MHSCVVLLFLVFYLHGVLWVFVCRCRLILLSCSMLCLYCGLFVGFWWVWFHHFLSFVGFCFLFVVFMVVVSDWLCLQTDSFQVMVLSPPRETFIVKEHCLLPAAGPAHRLPVRPLRLRLAQLVRLPVLRGGGAVVLRRPPHLLPHAPVPAAGPRPVHQLAVDGVLPLLCGRRAHLHRLHRGGGEGRRSLRPHRGVGVWLHHHLPDGRQPVDVLQRGLQPPGGVERVGRVLVSFSLCQQAGRA